MGNMQFNRQTIINAVANKSIAWIAGQDSSPAPINTFTRVSIYSPFGTISKLFNVRLQWDSENDATFNTGIKQFIIDVQTQPGVGTGGIGMLKLQNSPNGAILFDQGYMQTGNGQFPGDANAFNYQIANTQFDDQRAVQMVVWNGQNKPSSSLRKWDLFVEREVVSR